MAACGIDLIFNAEVSDTTSTHIGSARILSGSNSKIAFRAMFGPSSVATGSIAVKKFAGGTLMTTITSSGTGLQDISASGGSISSYTDGWYDFYASGSSSGVSVLIKGIKVTLY